MNLYRVMLEKLLEKHNVTVSKETVEKMADDLGKEIVYLLNSDVATRLAYALKILGEAGKPITLPQDVIGFQIGVSRSFVSTYVAKWKRKDLMYHTGRKLYLAESTMVGVLAHNKKLWGQVVTFFEKKLPKQRPLPLKAA